MKVKDTFIRITKHIRYGLIDVDAHSKTVNK